MVEGIYKQEKKREGRGGERGRGKRGAQMPKFSSSVH